MRLISQWALKFSIWGEWIGVLGVMVMVITTCADILGAKLFNLPLAGSIEIVSMVQVAALVFAVSSTQRYRGHISVDMFVEKFPPPIRSAVKVLVSLLGLLLFLLLFYEGILLGNFYLGTGEATATIQLPLYPFAYSFSIAMIPIVMMLLVDLSQAIKEVIR
jgi:TRAP-type C4-dicarboxylate transport system permease small subunit